MAGKDILDAAEALVIEQLAQAPKGLTNKEVIRRTGLYLDIPSQKGYITWTILQHLVQSGRAEKHGRLFKLKSPMAAENGEKKVKEGIHRKATTDELLEPFRKQVEESGITDDQLDNLFEEVREEVWREKQGKPQ